MTASSFALHPRFIASVIIALALLGLGSQTCRAQARNTTEDVRISLDGAPSMGAKDAKVIIVEFSDYQCPLSSQHFNRTMRQLVKDYVDTGKVRYVFRDFPIKSIHPLALKAAEAAYCAGEQGKYWGMHDRFLRNQSSIGIDLLPRHAEMLGLDVQRFQQCLDSDRYESTVNENATQGRQAGVRGTPSFFLGLNDPKESDLKVLMSVVGAQPYPAFKKVIDQLLSHVAQ